MLFACISPVQGVIVTPLLPWEASTFEDVILWLWSKESLYLAAAPILFSFCVCHMVSCYGNIQLYIMSILRWYDCTRIYIFMYKWSIALRNIYIGSHFLRLLQRRKPLKWLQKVAQVAVSRHFEHHAVFIKYIRVVRTTASNNGQERR